MTHSPDMGSPIARQTNAEQVVQRILGLIQAGVLQPGQQLPSERELAIKLGVSRPSLREAMRALSMMGALSIRQGGGAFVTSLSSQDLLAPLDFYFSLDQHRLENLFEAQIVLESEVARIAASRISNAQLEQLEVCLRDTEPMLEALLAWFEMDTQFHLLIAQAAENTFLERAVKSVRTLINRNRKATVQTWSSPRASHAEHQKVLAALSKRDPEASAQAMQAHLQRVHLAYQRYQEGQGHLSAGKSGSLKGKTVAASSSKAAPAKAKGKSSSAKSKSKGGA